MSCNKLLVIPCYQEGYLYDERWSRGWLEEGVPLSIELCSGNGSWIIERTKQDTGRWIAVEKKYSRAAQIYKQKCVQQLDRLMVVCGDGEVFLNYYLPAASVDHLFINFPDPWPKRRHLHHRLLNPSCVSTLMLVLKPQGRITLVTDDLPYLKWALSSLLPQSTPVFPSPYYTEYLSGYGSSFFEQLWRSQGKAIFYFEGIRQ